MNTGHKIVAWLVETAYARLRWFYDTGYTILAWLVNSGYSTLKYYVNNVATTAKFALVTKKEVIIAFLTNPVGYIYAALEAEFLDWFEKKIADNW